MNLMTEIQNLSTHCIKGNIQKKHISGTLMQKHTVCTVYSY